MRDEYWFWYMYSVLSEDLTLLKESEKSMPKLLTMEHKQLHVEVSQDKSWVYKYNQAMKV